MELKALYEITRSYDINIDNLMLDILASNDDKDNYDSLEDYLWCLRDNIADNIEYYISNQVDIDTNGLIEIDDVSLGEIYSAVVEKIYKKFNVPIDFVNKFPEAISSTTHG